MSLNNYNDLVSAVGDWMNRTDLAARVPDFISLCEAKLRRRIKHDYGLTSSVQFTIAAQSISLPDDFGGAISLLTDNPGAPTVAYRAHADFFNYVNNAAGQPEGYTILGGQLLIRPWPTAANFTLFYRAKLDLLKYGPNWVLENHPDAYLYGALAEAAPYMVEDDRVPLWQGLFEKALQEINMDGIMMVANAPVQIASNNPLPQTLW